MNEYETIYILKPDLPADRLAKLADRVEKILKEGSAEVLETRDWGKRKLSFPIRKVNYGHYVYYNYIGNGQFIAELERILKYEEEVIRYLTIKMGSAADAKKRDRTKKPVELEEAKVGTSESSAFHIDDRMDY